MLGKLIKVFTVLKQGQALADSATWKQAQVATNALVVIIGAILAFLPQIPLTPDNITDLATGIALIGGVVNAYFTVATSERVGLPATGADELSDTAAELPAENSINAGSKGLSGH